MDRLAAELIFNSCFLDIVVVTLPRTAVETNSKHWFTTSFLLLEEGAGKRCSECAVETTISGVHKLRLGTGGVPTSSCCSGGGWRSLPSLRVGALGRAATQTGTRSSLFPVPDKLDGLYGRTTPRKKKELSVGSVS